MFIRVHSCKITLAIKLVRLIWILWQMDYSWRLIKFYDAAHNSELGSKIEISRNLPLSKYGSDTLEHYH